MPEGGRRFGDGDTEGKPILCRVGRLGARKFFECDPERAPEPCSCRSADIFVSVLFTLPSFFAKEIDSPTPFAIVDTRITHNNEY